MLKHLFWPETIFARLNTAGQQLDHILSEADEITELGPELESVLDDSAAADRVRMMIDLEMFDLHHAIETRIRILAREKGVAYVAMLVEEVRKKNRARGYYVEKPEPYFTAGIPAEIDPDALYVVLAQPASGYGVGSVIRGDDCNWRSSGIIGHAKLPAKMTTIERNGIKRRGFFENLKDGR